MHNPQEKKRTAKRQEVKPQEKVFCIGYAVIKVFDRDNRSKLFCFHIGNRIGTKANETNRTGVDKTSFKSQNVFA